MAQYRLRRPTYANRSSSPPTPRRACVSPAILTRAVCRESSGLPVIPRSLSVVLQVLKPVTRPTRCSRLESKCRLVRRSRCGAQGTYDAGCRFKAAGSEAADADENLFWPVPQGAVGARGLGVLVWRLRSSATEEERQLRHHPAVTDRQARIAKLSGQLPAGRVERRIDLVVRGMRC